MHHFLHILNHPKHLIPAFLKPLVIEVTFTALQVYITQFQTSSWVAHLIFPVAVKVCIPSNIHFCHSSQMILKWSKRPAVSLQGLQELLQWLLQTPLSIVHWSYQRWAKRFYWRRTQVLHPRQPFHLCPSILCCGSGQLCQPEGSLWAFFFSFKDDYLFQLFPWLWTHEYNSEACFLVIGSWHRNALSSGCINSSEIRRIKGHWHFIHVENAICLNVKLILSSWNKLAKVCNLLLPVIWQLLAHSSSGMHRKSISPHESTTPAQTTNKFSNIHLLCQFFCLQTDHHGGNCMAILSLAHNPVFQCSFRCWKFHKAGMASTLGFGSLVMTSFFFCNNVSLIHLFRTLLVLLCCLFQLLTWLPCNLYSKVKLLQYKIIYSSRSKQLR